MEQVHYCWAAKKQPLLATNHSNVGHQNQLMEAIVPPPYLKV
jgi:hypothetical protein